MTRPDYNGTLYGAQRPASYAPPEPAGDVSEQVLDVTGEPSSAPPPRQAVIAAPDFDAYLPVGPSVAQPAAAPVSVAHAAPSTSDLVAPKASGIPTGTIARRARPAAAATATAGAASTALATGLAAGTAVPDASTRGAEVVPEPPRTGTVYGRQRDDGGGKALSGRLPRLRIGWHCASLTALSMIGVSSPGTGLILGADRNQRPVPIRFFRPESTRITLVGGAWAAQIVVFRALALGANAIIMTDDPTAWRGLGERATGARDRVIVNTGDALPHPPGTAQQPILVINDGALTGPSTAAELGPWQTQMTILRELDESGVPAIQDSHLVMVQRLGFGEASLATTALRLSGNTAQALQQLDDDMLALVGDGADQYMRISATDAERGYAGAARR